ncbi:MAG: hypothetical protein KAU50_10515 [Candidatus Marinimicrobia bacterium]|nr:hypothetical protein [Candidatus Neomarinimicrobiota bacterium]
MINKQNLLLALSIPLFVVANGQDQVPAGSPKYWPQYKADEWYRTEKLLALQGERPLRRDAIISGNRIRTIIWDNGSIGQPAREPSCEWPTFSNHGYAYEFGPFVGVEVPVDTSGYFLPYFDENGAEIAHDTSNKVWGATYHILSDGLRDGGAGLSSAEISPEGQFWTFEPIDDYANPESETIPLSNKKETWPSEWGGNWPGTYQVGASTADQAAYYAMDDRYNLEFAADYTPAFFPFPDDHSIGGMGLRVNVRIYQWANPLARDAIFFVYEITNTSENDYEKVVFGMFGDPHIGGSNDVTDDMAYFDKEINMIFGYDADSKGDWGGVTGWMGYMFLESPGNQYDLIDNDGDGLVDESMSNGIDDDGDWNPLADDVGIDGIGPDNPYYPGPDEGEGDGVPTAGDRYNPMVPGEPNFDGTDLDEADQIGLTSFNAFRYMADAISNDESMWNRTRPVTEIDSAAFSDIQQRADNVFLYGSSYFPLKAGDTQRFSIALLMGLDEKDLFATAKIVQLIYDSGYRFAKAPDIPTLSAVAGDSRVTLYWDDRAERSWDPVYGYDFEGYSVYRATDPGFTEVYTITDNNGNPKLFDPLKRFDLIDGITGESTIGIRGVHFDLGDDTGLRHEYIDTDVINGVTYYYAVASYDYGDTTGRLNIPPSESTMTIMEEGLTGVLMPDPNVIIVVPTAPAPGVQGAMLGEIEHVGPGTGTVTCNIMEPSAVRDDISYTITFGDPYIGGPDTVLYVTTETLLDTQFTVSTAEWQPVSEVHKYVTELTINYAGDDAIALPDSLYTFNAISGKIRFDSSLADIPIVMTFKPQPIFQSPYINSEDANAVFDGIRIYVHDDKTQLNQAETGWLNNDINYSHIVDIWGKGTSFPGTAYPHSYEIVWQDTLIPSIVDKSQAAPFIIYDITYPDSIVEVGYYLEAPVSAGKNFILGTHVIGLLKHPQLTLENKTWSITFEAPSGGDPVEPQPGDIFRIRTDKPFSADDVFTMTSAAANYDGNSVNDALAQIRVVPNPYIAQDVFEPPSGFASGRGDRIVHFINLPPICTIRIFTVAGELVNTINHDTSYWNGREPYNLLNKENMEIAFGMYIWHVDASKSGLGEKVGKFAVIK